MTANFSSATDLTDPYLTPRPTPTIPPALKPLSRPKKKRHVLVVDCVLWQEKAANDWLKRQWQRFVGGFNRGDEMGVVLVKEQVFLAQPLATFDATLSQKLPIDSIKRYAGDGPRQLSIGLALAMEEILRRRQYQGGKGAFYQDELVLWTLGTRAEFDDKEDVLCQALVNQCQLEGIRIQYQLYPGLKAKPK